MSLFTVGEVRGLRRAARHELLVMRADVDLELFRVARNYLPFRFVPKAMIGASIGHEDYVGPVWGASMGRSHGVYTERNADGTGGGSVPLWSKGGTPLEDLAGDDPAGYAEVLRLVSLARDLAHASGSFRIETGFTDLVPRRVVTDIAARLGGRDVDDVLSGPLEPVEELWGPADDDDLWADYLATAELIPDWSETSQCEPEEMAGTADDVAPRTEGLATRTVEDLDFVDVSVSPSTVPLRSLPSPEIRTDNRTFSPGRADGPLDAAEASWELGRRAHNAARKFDRCPTDCEHCDAVGSDRVEARNDAARLAYSPLLKSLAREGLTLERVPA